MMGEEFAGSEELGLARFSSTGFLQSETIRRTFLQNPKGSAEVWGGGGDQTCLLRTGFFSSQQDKHMESSEQLFQEPDEEQKPLGPLHAQTETEPNRKGAVLKKSVMVAEHIWRQLPGNNF